jgi:CRP-like cAMP-binding protein
VQRPAPSDLRSVPLFEALSGAELERLAGWFEVRSVEPGQRMIVEGSSGYSFLVITEGTADVIRDGKTVDTMSAGDFFGEGAMLDSGRRNADVVASTPMTIWWMFGVNFRQMQVEFPEIAERVAAAAQERTPR